MPRLIPYFGAVAAIALFALAAVFIDGTSLVRVSPADIASSTSLVLEPLGDAATTTDSADLVHATSSEVTTPPVVEKKKAAPSASTVPPPAPPAVAVTATLSPEAENAVLDAAASLLRAALVNIYCRVPLSGRVHIVSGSGVFIDPKGIILTNAHIAEYLLLADRGATCIIRSGSPAVDRYKAGLVFISSEWLRANAEVIGAAAPTGTGEDDFALLAVTRSATSAPLSSSFPSIPLATTPPAPRTAVVIGAYAAQFLNQSQLQTTLSPTIVFGSIKEVFTFRTNTVDVLALGGSAAAQEGSSGGGVTNASGMLIGTITTSTVEGDTSTRSLDAITASYIRAAYASETGRALDLLLAQPTATSIADFAPQIPVLEAIVTAHLQ